MEKKLILRGVLAGALAGLLAFVFARIFAEPLIQARPSTTRSGRDAAQAALDKAAGLPAATAGPGHLQPHHPGQRRHRRRHDRRSALAMGALFAVAYAVCLGRVGNLRPRTLALLVAGAGFLGFYLVPFVKYPANPPAIGHAETIQDRGGLYLLMVVRLGAVPRRGGVARSAAARNGSATGTRRSLAGAAFVVAIGIVMALLPSLGHLASTADVRQPRHRDTAAADQRRTARSSTRASPPTCCSTSGCTPSPRSSSCGRPSGWSSPRSPTGCACAPAGPPALSCAPPSPPECDPTHAAELAQLGPYFAVSLHSPGPPRPASWRPLSTLLDSPEDLRQRIAEVRSALAAGRPPGAVEFRVAASVTHLGVAARLISPPSGRRSSSAGRRGWTRPRCTGSRSSAARSPCRSLPPPWPGRDQPSAGQLGGELRRSVLNGPVRALTGVIAAMSVSPIVLQGNIASAVNAAAAMIARARPDRASPGRHRPQRATGRPELAGTWTSSAAGFRRRSCCLITGPPRRPPRPFAGTASSTRRNLRLGPVRRSDEDNVRGRDRHGHPEHITVQPISTLNDVHVVFMMDKGDAAHELLEFRREICERYITNSSCRIVTAADPERRRGPAARQAGHGGLAHAARRDLRAADSWRARRPRARRVQRWGDPAMYDGTVDVLRQVLARETVSFELRVIPGISSIQALAAQHKISLTRAGRPLHIATGPPARSGSPGPRRRCRRDA